MSDFTAIQEYVVENISRPVKYIIYKLTEFIRVVDKFIFRQVPAGAASGYANIEKIEGNTVAWNQLVSNGNLNDFTGWNINNASYTITDNVLTMVSTTSTGCLYRSMGFKSGHKYLLSLKKVSADGIFNFVIFNGDTRVYTSPNMSGTTTETYSFIYECANTGTLQIQPVRVQASGVTVSVTNIQIHDLTAIFGAGNEPTTVADFEAWLAQNIGTLPYYDYNAGELLSVKMSGMQTALANQNMFVDLGLPSGLLWAKSNIDVTQPNGLAASPYQYGCSFFSWGNVEGHNPVNNSFVNVYDWGGINAQEPWYEGQVYGNTNGSFLTGYIPANDTYDAARHNVRSLWRIPSTTDFLELKNNCDFIDVNGDVIPNETVDKRIIYNSTKGIRLRSKINGNEIFFACCGSGNSTTLTARGANGNYWTSTYYNMKQCRRVYIGSDNTLFESYQNRNMGFCIRPVIAPTDLPFDVTTITGINTSTNVREVIFADGMNKASDNDVDIIDLTANTAERATFVLPNTYQELEWLKSDGNAYIQTNLLVSRLYTYKLKFNITDFNYGGWVIGAKVSSAGSSDDFGVAVSAIRFGTQYVNKDFTTYNDVELIVNGVGYTINGEYTEWGNTPTINNDRALKLFWAQNSTAQKLGKIYYLQILDSNGVSLLHLIPAKRIADSVLGMYDMVSNTFLSNAGTGDFVAGPEVVKNVYPLATPITYTDIRDRYGNKLNGRYKVESEGTENILPQNTSTPISVAPIITTTYNKES